jgi:E3 ubiquitin-protein ligase XBAT32/33
MGLLGMMGDSFGCSATGERLVSAARDGDIQEARALLELNPRLARYSTFGIRNSPLHYSAAKGHHEIVSLLIESGVNINLRNCRGQVNSSISHLRSSMIFSYSFGVFHQQSVFIQDYIRKYT